MSSSDRITYRIIEAANEKSFCDLVVLATSPNEGIISNIKRTTDFNTFLSENSEDSLKQFPFVISGTVSEKKIIDYADLTNELNVIKIVGSLKNETTTLHEVE